MVVKINREYYLEIVIEKAKEILTEYGLKALNMNILAKECSLAKATLYKIIGSKDNLIEKIAFDYLVETRIKIINDLLDNEIMVESENFALKLAELSIGDLRILQKQILRDYPIIKRKMEKHWNESLLVFKNKFITLQNNEVLRQDLDPETIIEGFKIIFDYYCLSDLPDAQISEKIQLMFNVILRGIDNV